MDQREMAASTALSVVIVAAVAIFLREPDVARAKATLSKSEVIDAPVVERPGLAEAPRVEPARASLATKTTPSLLESVLPGPSAGVSPSLAQVVGPDDRPLNQRGPDRVAVVSHRRPIRPTQTRGAFTTVEEGESLTDVALRIYGEESARERLWAANRDELPRRDSQLRAGTLLRTP